MAENYTAGRLLVAVVPDMRGFAAKVRKEVGGIGPFDVRVNVEVDDKALAGLRAALRSLPDVVVTADTSPADRKLAELRARMAALSDREIGVSISAAEAHREVDSIRSDLDSLSGVDVKVDADVSAAKRSLDEISRDLGRVSGKTANIKVDADTGRANAALVFTQTLARRVGAVNPVIRVNVITADAISGLTRLAAMITLIGGLGGMLGGLAGAVGGIGAAAVVAGVGVAAIIPAFLGVGKALGALNTQQEDAGKTASASAKAQASAAKQVESAQRAVGKASEGVNRARADGARQVSDAERSAARNIESALESQAQAQRRLKMATTEVRMVQQELTRAWEDGRRALEDLQDQVDDNALDQRQAAFDLADARKALSEAKATGDTDQIARAQLAYDRVIERVDQLNKRTQRGATDNAKAQKAGVAGTDQYRSAQDRLTSAMASQYDASQAAAKADRDVDRARADGARDVQRAQIDAARSISDAQSSLVDSQRQLTEALNATRDAGTDAGDKVADAFAKLSPAAAAFVRYLFGLKPVLNELSGIAASGLFPPLTAGIDTLLTRLPLIKTVVGQLAAGMGAGLQGVLTTLANPWWAAFFATLGNAAGTVIPRLFASLMTLVQAAGSLILAFLPFADVGFGVLDALSGLITVLAGPLAQALAGMAPAAHALIDALSGLGPLLLALSPILNALGVALGSVLAQALTWLTTALIAAEPYLLAFAEWARANPDKVLMIAGAIVGLVLAMRGLAWIHSLLVPLSAIGVLFAKIGVAVGGMSGIMAKLGMALRFVLGPWGLLIGALVLAYTTSEPFRNAINGLLGVIMQLAGQLIGAVMPVFDALAGVLTMVAGVVGVLVGQLAAALVPVINIVAVVLTQLVGAILPPLVGIIQALLPVVGLLGGVFVQLVAALAPVITMVAGLVAQFLPPLVSLIASAVVPIITFLAYVLGKVLVLAINYLLIPALKLITWLLTNVTVPIITWMASMVVPVFQAIGAAAMWLWANAIKPAFDGVAAAATWLWVTILSPVFSAIWTGLKILGAIIFVILVAPFLIAFNLVSAAAKWLWSAVLQPVFQAIGTFIAWVWTYLIKPALDALVWFWSNVLAPAAMWLYNNVIKPVFQAIGAFIAWVWTYLIKPALDAMVWFWSNVIAPAATWLYQNIIKPMFEGMGTVIKWVWENVIRPAFDAIKTGLQWVGDKFDQVTTWIGDIWAKIRGFLAKPINFMINTVWNQGIRPAWNAVAVLFGLDPIAEMKAIPENATGGPIGAGGGTRRAGGGMLRGPGSGTDDKILGIDAKSKAPTSWVSNREFVVREAVARKTAPFLRALNAGEGEALQAAGGLSRVTPKAYRGRSGFDMNVPRRAGGGPVDARIDQAKRFLSTEARGIPYVYGGGTSKSGTDCSGMVAMVTHILSGRSPWSGRMGGTGSMPWSGFAPGLNSAWAVGSKPNDHMAGTLAGQNVEQHGPNGTPFSFPSRWGADNGYFSQRWNLPVVGGQFVSGGEGGGGGGSFFRSAFEALTNPLLDGLRGLVGDPPPEWRRVPVAMATKVRDTIAGWLGAKDDESGGGGPAMQGTGPVADQVRAVATKFGWGQGPQWDAINWIIGNESGWDPNAQNKGSTAYGLFQFLDATWGSVGGRKSNNPGEQAEYAMRYFKQRYRDPLGAKAFWQANHWYGSGGEVGATPFDSGGEAFGKGLMFKDVIAKERVLDPEQTSDYDVLSDYRRMLDDGRLVPARGLDARQLAAMGAGANGSGGREMHLHVHGDVNDPMDVDSLYNMIDFRERSARL